MSQINNVPLQQLLDQFDEVINWFEQEEIDVEQSLEKFDEAQKLAEQIRTRLDIVENKITVLKKSFDTN